ncbi:hypothetical protein COOONC_00850 [Cooperia oncophora]
METIEVADRSSDEDPKWMVHGDQLEINCKAPECEQVVTCPAWKPVQHALTCVRKIQQVS